MKPLIPITPMSGVIAMSGASRIPAAAARAALIPQATEKIRGTLTPTRAAASLFWAVAHIAQPRRVKRKNATNPRRHASDTATIPIPSGVKVMPAMLKGLVLSIGGNRASSLPRNARTPLRSIWATAMVERITVKTGAFSSGR